jgi:hypothetical protein
MDSNIDAIKNSHPPAPGPEIRSSGKPSFGRLTIRIISYFKQAFVLSPPFGKQ